MGDQHALARLARRLNRDAGAPPIPALYFFTDPERTPDPVADRQAPATWNGSGLPSFRRGGSPASWRASWRVSAGARPGAADRRRPEPRAEGWRGRGSLAGEAAQPSAPSGAHHCLRSLCRGGRAGSRDGGGRLHSRPRVPKPEPFGHEAARPLSRKPTCARRSDSGDRSGRRKQENGRTPGRARFCRFGCCGSADLEAESRFEPDAGRGSSSPARRGATALPGRRAVSTLTSPPDAHARRELVKRANGGLVATAALGVPLDPCGFADVHRHAPALAQGPGRLQRSGRFPGRR